MAFANYDDVLGQLRGAGLIVDQLEVGTPRPVRCKVEGDREKRGWYILHEFTTTSGDLLIVGSFGAWRGSDNHAQKVELRKIELSADQRDALRRRLADDRKRADQVRKRETERAAARAESMWRRLEPAGDSDYLTRKGVIGHGLRFTPTGTAVVPLLDTGGRIHGLQFLRTPAAAQKAKRPAKEFWPAGLAKKGHFHLLGSPGPLILIAEGYATAASLHMATGHPVAVAFDAGNLTPVATALRKRYKQARILICADDDILGKCQARTSEGTTCGTRLVLTEHPDTCPSCGEPHRYTNAGVAGASTAALAVDGAWLVPAFRDPAARSGAWLAGRGKSTDFNDLHAEEGLPAVRVQVEARLSALRWDTVSQRAVSPPTGGGGAEKLRPIQYLDDLLQRYALVYASGGAVFDRREHCLLPLTDMRNACIRSDLHKAWMEHPDRNIVRTEEVGFDPAECDPGITCNLWGGWPTQPKAGNCERLIELLRYMCKAESNAEELFQWVLRWVAYPIQHPGAKMKTTVVVHGPQGTGKNLFFETVMAIYGKYGRILDQDALEDKHNDWASRKLFLIADEVIAQSHKYQIKNKLKTLITGTWVRINPKHIAAYDEANHVNLVFLSNEAMPVVLEEDDRRHCVIWTPPKQSLEYYKALMAEIAAGGAAALHDYLLKLDLGDFNPGTQPPGTAAKTELISLAQDSPVEFVDSLFFQEVMGLQDRPGLTTDWYEVYKIWCGRVGVRHAPMKRFVNAIERKRGIRAERKRYADLSAVDEYSVEPPPIRGPHSVLMFGHAAPEGESETLWLGNQIDRFRKAVADLRGGSR